MLQWGVIGMDRAWLGWAVCVCVCWSWTASSSAGLHTQQRTSGRTAASLCKPSQNSEQEAKMKLLLIRALLCLFVFHLSVARLIPEGVPYDEPPAVPYWPYSTSDFWNYIEYFRSIGAYNHINEMARAFYAQQALGDTLGYETNAGHED
ncbi:otospiralin [Girardinichthys multiradiatus]|uniref:otospiralin n=1 Tax=Girardinichthys multiradiatus TaxID=208333 RepID=UPI001FAC1CE2|nr:otospiralin [Girardinichthys multiradiatus]